MKFPRSPLFPVHPTVRVAIVSAGLLASACGPIEEVSLPDDSVFDAETGFDAAGDSHAESSDAASESGGSTDTGDGGSSDEGEVETSRITAMWTEAEGMYVRAVPGDELVALLPSVSEVAVFLPSAAQSETDDSVYVSLLDVEGEPVLAMKTRSRSTHPDGFAVETGAEVAYFSKWAENLPLGYCVTEPCPIYPWDEAHTMMKLRSGDQSWFEGQADGQRVTMVVLGEGQGAEIVEQKGFDTLHQVAVADFKRVEVASADLLELSVEIQDEPLVPASWDPCEALENLAQGGTALGMAACCAESLGLVCLGCLAAGQSLIEKLEELCSESDEP